MSQRSVIESLVVGAGGAAAVTLLHEGARRRLKAAPRMDVVGKRALKRILSQTKMSAPRGRALHRWTLAGELVANTAYYALAALGRPSHPLRRGLALGALAGAGALSLTPRLGLGLLPVRRSRATAAMTFSWYLLGGLAAGALAEWLVPKSRTGSFFFGGRG